jgi:hypothetical protein
MRQEQIYKITSNHQKVLITSNNPHVKTFNYGEDFDEILCYIYKNYFKHTLNFMKSF